MPATDTPDMEPQSATWLIGRRDVAILPWLCAALVAAGLLGSLAALGEWTPESRLIAACAGLLIVISAGSLATHLTKLGPYLARQLWPYVLGSNVVGIAIAASLVVDPTVGTVLIAGNVVVASYMGLVLPPRIARTSMLVVLAATLIADAAADVPTADASLHLGIPVVGWLIGMLTARVHHRLATRAVIVSSSDGLTGALNRRGFTARLSWLLGQHRTSSASISLLILDLDGFKAINDSEGHAAGDELLAWVGEQLHAVAPDGAEVGRLGGDEFAIALANATLPQANALAEEVRSTLAERIGCSIGSATSADPRITDEDLFRVADAALYACKEDRALGTQSLMAGVGRPSAAPAGRSKGRPPLGTAVLRRTTREPIASDDPGGDLINGWLAGRGLLVIALAGLPIVVSELVNPGDHWADTVLQLLGVPWFLTLLGVSAWAWRIKTLSDWQFRIVFAVSLIGVAGGVSFAMLAGGGLIAAIGAALFLKLQFDASVMPGALPRISGAVILAFWAMVAALGPADALWAAPFQLALFGAAYLLGSLGYRAYREVREQLLDLARTDVLTGALSRHGFEERAAVLLRAATTEHLPAALLAIDLDRFKQVNDTRGHAAGDEVLRQVVLITRATMHADAAIGRIGGDEFAILLPNASEFEARRAATELTAALQPVIGASIGHAIAPPEGVTLEALQRVADRRSYRVKHAGRARNVA